MRIAVLGAGGHARVIIALAKALNEAQVVALFDDDPAKQGTHLDGVLIVGAIDEFDPSVHAEGAVLAIGDNARRQQRANAIEAEWVTLVHPHSWVDPMVKLGGGSVVFAGAAVQCGSLIGSHSIVNTAAVVDHDCIVGDFVHVAPHSTLAGGVTVGDGALIGVGASIAPGVSVGSWARIGVGAAVVADIDDGLDAVGVPARPL